MASNGNFTRRLLRMAVEAPSPMIAYSPRPNNNDSLAWTSSWDVSLEQWTEGTKMANPRQMTSSAIGATAQFAYEGTSACVWGSFAGQGTVYQIQCDQVAYSYNYSNQVDFGALGCCQFDKQDLHMMLWRSPRTTYQVSLDGFTYSTVLQSAGSLELSRQANYDVTGANNNNASAPAVTPDTIIARADPEKDQAYKRTPARELQGIWDLVGNWSQEVVYGGALGTSSSIMYPRAIGRAGSYVTFSAPANTTYLWLEGSVAPDHGRISVRGRSREGSSLGTTIFNLTANDPAPGQVIYLSRLDPGQNWSFNVSHVDGELFDLAALHYWQFTNGSASDSASPSVAAATKSQTGLSAGAKAGIALGCIVGLGLWICLGLAAVRHWRRKQTQRKADTWFRNHIPLTPGQSGGSTGRMTVL